MNDLKCNSLNICSCRLECGKLVEGEEGFQASNEMYARYVFHGGNHSIILMPLTGFHLRQMEIFPLMPMLKDSTYILSSKM